MLSTIITASALLALASAQDFNTVTNNMNIPINFAYDGTGGVLISSGTIAAGASMNFNLGDSFNVKMCATCDPTTAESGLLQFEFNLNTTTNQVFYDWSLVNGPDPFPNSQHSIVPGDSSCPSQTCAAGDQTNDCGQFTDPTNGVPEACNIGANPQLVATIG